MREKQREFLHSGAASKGLQALTTMAPDNKAGTTIQAYLQAHNARVTQCKALLEVLAHNTGSLALQVLLTVSSHYPSKSVQALARDKIGLQAKQHGWSTEQLADRLVPTAGLDSKATLILDCGGGRRYHAQLDADHKLVLSNPACKPG
jgi:hypothetical protein